MNHLLICTILGFALLGINQISEARWFGPSTYEDCILESMKGVTNDIAAKAIEKACRKKFPYKRAKRAPLPKIPESYSLSLDVLNNIKGGAEWMNILTQMLIDRSNSEFRMRNLAAGRQTSEYPVARGQMSSVITGTIYNKTDKWILTNITIKIEPKDKTKKTELSHICNIINRGIRPKQEETFSCYGIYTPEGEFEFNWSITEAKGYQLK